MHRILALTLVALLAVTALIASPASATHTYGHQFMVVGRMIGPDGEPAEGTRLLVTVETRLQQDPFMTIQTDCYGLFYTDNSRYPDQSPGEDRGLESSPRGEVMHIHTNEYRRDSEFHVRTEYGNYSAPASAERQFSAAKIRLEASPPPQAECDEEVPFEQTYVVAGRLQSETNTGGREDLRTIPGQSSYEVTVTLETEDGPVTESGFTTTYGDYIISFDNVTVRNGARITASYGDTTETGRVDTTYRLTAINLFEERPLVSETTRNVLFIVLGVVIVGGLGFWGYTTMKDRAELARARETTTRKRANK